MKTKKFTIDTSFSKQYSKKEIEETLKQNTKKSLLESVLTWKYLAKQWEQNYNELKNK